MGHLRPPVTADSLYPKNIYIIRASACSLTTYDLTYCWRKRRKENSSNRNPQSPRSVITVPVVYIARDVMILMRATSITRANERGGGGPENRDSSQGTI
jgi:hypothetical protein